MVRLDHFWFEVEEKDPTPPTLHAGAPAVGKAGSYPRCGSSVPEGIARRCSGSPKGQEIHKKWETDSMQRLKDLLKLVTGTGGWDEEEEIQATDVLDDMEDFIWALGKDARGLYRICDELRKKLKFSEDFRKDIAEELDKRRREFDNAKKRREGVEGAELALREEIRLLKGQLASSRHPPGSVFTLVAVGEGSWWVATPVTYLLPRGPPRCPRGRRLETPETGQAPSNGSLGGSRGLGTQCPGCLSLGPKDRPAPRGNSGTPSGHVFGMPGRLSRWGIVG
ncbi:hypothetical protein EAI_06239 [Harpegnathos saltator]|uniref:Uncharacterized protein n=1 Tax=Harpegnathos saltator TaxID=610380 RepID=E2C198_HARSA|nr:hypothetical protein EAI_06239 [Harpegnathos saltator]